MANNPRIENDRNYLLNLINELKLEKSIEEYVAHYLLYAEEQTRKAKIHYYICTCVTVFCPMLILIIEQVDPRPIAWPDYLTIFFTLCSTVGASLLSVFRFRDRWCHFRSYLERGIQILVDAQSIKDKLNSSTISSQDKLLDDFKKLNSEELSLWQNIYHSHNKE